MPDDNITDRFANQRVYQAQILARPSLAGTSQQSDEAGVSGTNTVDGSGVSGESNRGIGVVGESSAHDGVQGRSHHPSHAGVAGLNELGAGVVGDSKGHDGVRGTSHHPSYAGVKGVNEGGGYGLHGIGDIAGFFEGNVTMTGDLTMTGGGDIRLSDFAEDFDVSEDGIEPGSVVILDQGGAVQNSRVAYDKKVAGVVSGAGNYRPAITLDRRDSREGRIPVALMGRVYCKVDAKHSAIEVGDLLTTSDTPGHAMKAVDGSKAFGAIIGKALSALEQGQGMIPILIALQ